MGAERRQVGLAIPKPGGTPSLALSIAALASQTDEGRIDSWKQIMREEVDAVLKAEGHRG